MSRSFKYEHFWFEHREVRNIIQEEWNTTHPNWSFEHAMDIIKYRTLKWSKHTLGNLEIRALKAQNKSRQLEAKDERVGLTDQEIGTLRASYNQHSAFLRQISIKL